jgi:NAD-dependent dihydropyrimidine dehydrogenase PreA subunit
MFLEEFKVTVNEDCIACKLCLLTCPVNALTMEEA